MEKTTIYLPADLKIAIKATARRSGRSEAMVVREALARYVTAESPNLPSFVGSVEDGSFDAANDEAWLAENWKPDW